MIDTSRPQRGVAFLLVRVGRTRHLLLTLAIGLNLVASSPAGALSLVEAHGHTVDCPGPGLSGDVFDGHFDIGPGLRSVTASVLGHCFGREFGAHAGATAVPRFASLFAETRADGSADSTATAYFDDRFRVRASAPFQGAYIAHVTGALGGNSSAAWDSFPRPTGAPVGSTQVPLHSGETIIEMPFSLPAGRSDPLFFFQLAVASGNVGLELDVNSFADFFGTATLFLQLPEGVTFEGTESGEFFADRTDFILRPGQLPGEAVPEPSTLILFVVAAAPLGYALRKRVVK